MKKLLFLLSICQLSFVSFSVNAAELPRSRRYALGQILIEGSRRISAEQVSQICRLSPGTPLDDNRIMNARTRLLGLGLFRDVLLRLKRSELPETADLVVQLEDDPNVLGSQALGATLGVQGHRLLSDQDGALAYPVLYHFGLLSRNLARSQVRGDLQLKASSGAKLHSTEAALGLAPQLIDDLQLDWRFEWHDMRRDYLDGLGFTDRHIFTLSLNLDESSTLSAGFAHYHNRSGLALPGSVGQVIGPYVMIQSRTALRAFLRRPGHMVRMAFVPSLEQLDQSVFEVNLSHTLPPIGGVWTTAGADIMGIGDLEYALRAYLRLGLPVAMSHRTREQTELFLRILAGSDVIEADRYWSSSATLGLRYHSPGFIGELAFSVQRASDELATTEGGEL